MFFKKGPSPHQTAVAMVGAKAGQTVVILGAADPALAAEIALVTGLNGRTVVVDRGAGPAVDAAAARAGALVEYLDTPAAASAIESAAADLVVVHARFATRTESDRAAILDEAARLARPGKRIVVIEGAQRTGALSKWRAAAPALDAAIAVSLLGRAGLTATRLLGESEGVSYFEGVKRGAPTADT